LHCLYGIGSSWPWSYGSWIYSYLWNQCRSPLMLWVRISIRARCKALCDKVLSCGGHIGCWIWTKRGMLDLKTTYHSCKISYKTNKQKQFAWWCLTPLSTIFPLYRGSRGRDRTVVGFTTTYAISTYYHWCCEFESQSERSVKHYVIKFVSDLRQVGGFLRVLRFPPPITLTNIYEKNWQNERSIKAWKWTFYILGSFFNNG
jgi:hypothetical protein